MEHSPAQKRPLPRIAAAFIAVQIAVPLLALGGRWAWEGFHPEHELPLSWQMYSATDIGSYVGTTAGGDEVPLSVDSLSLLERSVWYGDEVQQKLCDQAADLISVRRESGRPDLDSEPTKC